MKTCKVCGQDKSLDQYYKWCAKCKSCYNEMRRKRYNSDPEFRTRRAHQIQERKEQRKKEDLSYWLHKRISYQIRRSCPGKKIFREYGIDVANIISTIGERPEGDYHLDHILPQVAFDYNDPFEVWACNHPKNLRWLPAKENISKGDKYKEEDFLDYITEIRAKWDASRDMRNGMRSG